MKRFPRIPHIVRAYLLSFAGWTFLAAIMGSHEVALGFATWTEIIVPTMRDWFPWAVLSPLLFRVSSWLPLEGWRGFLALPMHVICLTGMLFLCHWWNVQIPTLARKVGIELPPPGSANDRRPIPAGHRREGSPFLPPPVHPEDLPDDAPPPAPPRRGRPRGQSPPDPPSVAVKAWGLLPFKLPPYLMTVCAAYAALFYRRFHERDASLNKARLDALRHQLQPHFLFNTLNVIASLVHEDPRRADAMLTALADLLRFTLETSGDQVVPLHRETAFIGRYLALMNARFEDRLRYSIEITPETYSALVPVLLLQPIVENAIEHGIQQKPDGGSVSIRAFLQLGKLHIEIVDDGVGIPEGHDIRMGIGIRNTIGRLEERYGKNAKLRITSPPGTKVEIIIPHRPA